jgi:thiamine-monophosphate kinase
LRDASRIARASDVGIQIESAAVPTHPAALEAAEALGVDPLTWALTGGEDHCLLATYPSGTLLPDGWTIVGEVVDEYQGIRVDGVVPEALGWDHFGA